MAISSSLEQTTKQQLNMNARQIESLEILGMSSAELTEYIQEEHLSNPMLELEDVFPQKMKQYDVSRGTGSGRETGELRETPQDALPELPEYLISQFPIKQLSRRQLLLLTKMTDYIDTQTGYFTASREEMTAELDATEEEVDTAYAQIRNLEPAGIGAANMRDCLRLQLERRGQLDDVIAAIIDHYLDKVAAGKLSSISRSLKISTEKVRQYIQLLKSLNPRPAQMFGGDKHVYVIPDVVAKYVDNRWDITLTIPVDHMLHLNETYMKMAAEAQEPELIQYFAEKIKRAREILVAAQQREDTLQNMVEILLDMQKAYALGTGEKCYLTQKSMAEELGVHPSTIHRAVKNKYIQVPIGVVPLSSFFSARKTQDTGRKELPGDTDDGQTVMLPAFGGIRTSGKDIACEGEEAHAAVPDQVTEICLIAPTEELMRQNQRVCALYGKKVDAYRASLPEARQVVSNLLRRGAKIFISRKGTKKTIEEQAVPIVEIGLSLTDYIPLMERAKRVKGKVAFFSYGIIPEDVRSMCYLLGIDVLFYSFHKVEQCMEIVRAALDDGAVLGLGGADTAAAARQLGLEHLTVENSEKSLLQAIEAAEQLLEVQKEEARKQEELKIRLERYEMVFNYTHDAIIAVNENGIVDVLNLGAEKIIKSGNRPYQGKKIGEIIPDTRLEEVVASGEKELNQLMNINGTLVSTNRLPIIVDGKVRGAVATFQDVKTIQSNEQKIRVKLHEKGLVARYNFSDIIGNSHVMQDLMRMAEKFAKSDATILLHGETGTGKELLAQSIHNSSKRKTGPFVAVNCGSLPRNILEAELFGYVDGAFTGASKGGKMGLFEMAHGGTIFLDEIGEMPLETQVQLLRVLQEKEIRRLGSDRVTPVDIRVITATNRNLPEEIAERNFREDLYYRLNVLNLEIPPLRHRREDILPIAVHIFRQFAAGDETGEELISRILSNLQTYTWPGNVREVHNLAERIYVLYSQGEEEAFIEKYIRGYLRTDAMLAETTLENRVSVMPGEQKLEDWEREQIINALRDNHLEVTRTAEHLGISRSTLWRKMKKYGITTG